MALLVSPFHISLGTDWPLLLFTATSSPFSVYSFVLLVHTLQRLSEKRCLENPLLFGLCMFEMCLLTGRLAGSSGEGAIPALSGTQHGC